MSNEELKLKKNADGVVGLVCDTELCTTTVVQQLIAGRNVIQCTNATSNKTIQEIVSNGCGTDVVIWSRTVVPSVVDLVSALYIVIRPTEPFPEDNKLVSGHFFTIEKEQESSKSKPDKYEQQTRYRLYRKNRTGEHSYLDLLRQTISTGVSRDGRNGKVTSLFSKELTFDLDRDGFPLLTTKKMFFRGIVEEFLFFLRGQTDSKLLEDKKVNIWRDNTSRSFLDKHGFTQRREGLMGPMYGYQWRFFNRAYGKSNCTENDDEKTREIVDQLQYVVDTIRTDPHSRRILMTSYNPLQAKDGVLFPCHSIILQFYVTDRFLNLICYNRSQDLFLGVPFNIASSALLLEVVAKLTNYQPRFLHMHMGDCHVYDLHLTAVKDQLTQIPWKFPRISIQKTLSSISDAESLVYEDFGLSDYHGHKSISAPMIA